MMVAPNFSDAAGILVGQSRVLTTIHCMNV